MPFKIKVAHSTKKPKPMARLGFFDVVFIHLTASLSFFPKDLESQLKIHWMF